MLFSRSFFYISQLFSSKVPRHEMTFFAVMWTTLAFDDKFSNPNFSSNILTAHTNS